MLSKKDQTQLQKLGSKKDSLLKELSNVTVSLNDIFIKSEREDLAWNEWCKNNPKRFLNLELKLKEQAREEARKVVKERLTEDVLNKIKKDLGQSIETFLEYYNKESVSSPIVFRLSINPVITDSNLHSNVKYEFFPVDNINKNPVTGVTVLEYTKIPVEQVGDLEDRIEVKKELTNEEIETTVQSAMDKWIKEQAHIQFVHGCFQNLMAEHRQKELE